jgi:hypothetical protein
MTLLQSCIITRIPVTDPYQSLLTLGELLVGHIYIEFSINRKNTRKPTSYLRPHVAQDVIVHDISGDEDKYTIDSHGFQYVKHESKEKDFLDDEQIKAVYYPETEQLLKDA